MKNLKGIEKSLILEKINSVKNELDKLTDFTDAVYKSNFENVLIISEFKYKGFMCTFFKDNNRFIFTYEKDDYVEVCIFNTFEEILCYIINSKLKRSYKYRNNARGVWNGKNYSRKNQ